MELEFVKWLASQSKPHRHVALGIGDDAAVLELPAGSQTVVTTDMVTDGVHFHLRDHSAELIGRKAVAVNLSDLAAMAAEPVATFVSLNIPRTAPTTLPRELLAGMQHLAAEYDCPIAGGDTNVTDGPLVISVVAIGSVAPGRAWLRSGCNPAIVCWSPASSAEVCRENTSTSRLACAKHCRLRNSALSMPQWTLAMGSRSISRG